MSYPRAAARPTPAQVGWPTPALNVVVYNCISAMTQRCGRLSKVKWLVVPATVEERCMWYAVSSGACCVSVAAAHAYAAFLSCSEAGVAEKGVVWWEAVSRGHNPDKTWFEGRSLTFIRSQVEEP